MKLFDFSSQVPETFYLPIYIYIATEIDRLPVPMVFVIPPFREKYRLFITYL